VSRDGDFRAKHFDTSAEYAGFLFAQELGLSSQSPVDGIINAKRAAALPVVDLSVASAGTRIRFEMGVDAWIDDGRRAHETAIYMSEPYRISIVSSPSLTSRAQMTRFIIFSVGPRAGVDFEESTRRLIAGSTSTIVVSKDVAGAPGATPPEIRGDFTDPRDLSELIRTAVRADAGNEDPYIIAEFPDSRVRVVIATNGNRLIYAGIMHQLLMPNQPRGISDVLFGGKPLPREEFDTFFVGAATALERAMQASAGHVMASELPIPVYWSLSFAAVQRPHGCASSLLMVVLGEDAEADDGMLLRSYRHPFDVGATPPVYVDAPVRRMLSPLVAPDSVGLVGPVAPRADPPAPLTQDWDGEVHSDEGDDDDDFGFLDADPLTPVLSSSRTISPPIGFDPQTGELAPGVWPDEGGAQPLLPLFDSSQLTPSL